MNFKTIFSVAILALVASSLEDQIATIKKECRSDNEGKAIFKMMMNLVYACLRGYIVTRNLMLFNGPNHLYARLRNYPDKSKIELNPRLMLKNYQNVFQYICVLPDSGKEDLSNKIILTVDEKPYYVYTDNTNIDLCIETSQNYNKEQCLFLINLIGKTDNINSLTKAIYLNHRTKRVVFVALLPISHIIHFVNNLVKGLKTSLTNVNSQH
ncbi:hypothetical protein BCR32DRAFT_296509 [Anaeromyces robustus]|uniref:Uncharacterized protein n=1 Tax=Anaeromyces robustus TaxID=1754192 RepID=A0A1Y1WRM4_9FUNG|nr:hypothetical protein BCR32DRAFT_296509 [Anaeromyces robustus]|eukprot:ORX76035.1 hypothetical protein BCR32DRAFT_296509 [Anaeromyces robustus]